MINKLDRSLRQACELSEVVFSSVMRKNIVSVDMPVGSQPSTECLEHELGSPKVNVWCALTHKRDIVSLYLTRTSLQGIYS
jgi:hypothetical protein